MLGLGALGGQGEAIREIPIMSEYVVDLSGIRKTYKSGVGEALAGS